MDGLDTLIDEHSERLVDLDRPTVTLSYAQSLDGSITATRGNPLSLSCHESLMMVHQLRANHDAIAVGIGTLLADDPRLNVRMVEGEDPQPLVLDSRLRTPPRSVLLQRDKPRPWVVTTEFADVDRQAILEGAGARVIRLPANHLGHVDLHALMTYLFKRGVKTLMLEGGAQIITAFLDAGLVDRCVVTIAPVMVGGQRAVESLLMREEIGTFDPNCPTLDCYALLRDVRYVQVGTDLVVFGRLR
jgi:3,4-dihydroxy 2-butanone 4-phosphate synthase/GTP cyclohydrolase II